MSYIASQLYQRDFGNGDDVQRLIPFTWTPGDWSYDSDADAWIHAVVTEAQLDLDDLVEAKVRADMMEVHCVYTQDNSADQDMIDRATDQISDLNAYRTEVQSLIDEA